MTRENTAIKSVNTFDEIFVSLLDDIRTIDSSAQMEVYCQCAECPRCDGGTICGRTKFFSSLNNQKKPKTAETKKEAYYLYSPDRQKIHFEVCVFTNKEIPQSALSDKRHQITRKASMVSAKKLRSLRDAVVDASMASTDIASFCFRAISGLKNIVKFDGASLFISERETKKIELVATTGIKKMRNSKLLKKDIFYQKDSKSYTSKCFTNRLPIYEMDRNGLIENTLGEDLPQIFNRLYYPIQIRKESFSGRKDFGVSGVLRISNLRKNGEIQPCTKHEAFLLEYFCEYVFILSRLYQQASNPFGMLERATHGFIHDLSILSGRIGMFDQTVTAPYKRALENTIMGPSLTTEEQTRLIGWSRKFFEEYQLYMEDMLGVIESMSAQLHSVLDTTNLSAGRPMGPKGKITEQPFRQVFLKLDKASPFIAKSHNKQSPTINFTSPGEKEHYRYMPSLKIDPDTLFLVFRNLLENSIKYQNTAPTQPRIEIEWRRKLSRVEITFSDNGIGIPIEEERYLFQEGFRGRPAVLASTRGNGIGLAYIKQALEASGGTIEYLGCASGGLGCKFKIKISEADS